MAANTSKIKSQVIYEYLVNVVNRSELYIIVERSALQAAVNEIDISPSGMIDDGITYLSVHIVFVETGQVSSTAVLSMEEDEYIASLANRTISQLLGGTKNKYETAAETKEKTVVA